MSRTRGATIDVGWPQRFYYRSDDLQSAANWTSIIIFTLLLLGGLVFYIAPQITLNDLAGNTIGTRIEISTKRLTSDRLQLESILQSENEMVIDLTNPLIAMIGHYTTGKALVRFDTMPIAGSISLQTVVRKRLDIREQINKLLQSAPKNDLPITINFGAGTDSAIMMIKKDWLDLASLLKKVLDQTDFHSLDALKAQSDSLQDAIQHETEVLAALRGLQIQKEINGTDSPNPEDMKSLSTVRLIQTNVTRFGALAILTFLVTILIPVYRYKIKLAAYYTARGDALQMRQDGTSDIAFVLLTNSLTPIFDFGKMPQTPVEQIIDLVKANATNKS